MGDMQVAHMKEALEFKADAPTEHVLEKVKPPVALVLV